MKRGKELTIILLLVVGIHGNGVAQTPTDELKKNVENELVSMVSLSPPGATVTVYWGDEYFTVSSGIKKEGEPVVNDKKYLFRSFTKFLVSTIILQLQEENKLDINDELSEYIDPVSTVDMTVTLKELLSMKANVCNFISNSWALIQGNEPTVFDVREVLESQIPNGICNQAKNYEYNDTNFQLLGLVIEAVTGKSGEEVFEERLFSQIEQSSLELAPINITEESMNGLWVDLGNGPKYVGNFSTNALLIVHKFNGGVVGNTKDMLRLLKSIMDGEVITQESISLMKSIGDGDYGLGLMNRSISGDVLYGHGGSGMNRSRTFYNSELNLGISVAINYSNNQQSNVEKFLSDVYEYLKTCREDDGCTPKNQTSSFIDKTFIHNEVTREYSIFIPASYSTDKDWPLVINFHGYTGDIADQVDRTKMNDLADSLDFLIAYPQGININRSSGILPGFVPLSGSGWSVPGFSDERNEIAFVDSLINHIQKEYSIDGERVHTAGVSLGGFMALYAATQMPDKIASFASVIGHMTDDVLDLFDENTQTSALLVHGTNDIITSYNGLSGYYKSVPETASIFADRNNCSLDSTESSLTDINSGDNTTVTLIEYSQCDDDREVKLYRVNNGGHRWPGSGRTEPEIIGNNSLDLNATKVILDFFISNPKVAVNNEQEIPTPKNFLLFQNYPNPFNPTTNISFELPGSSLVQLKVYNLLGQEVATLVDGRMNSGTHQLRFDASNLSSGVYVYRLTTGSQSITKKMLLIK